MMIMAKPKTLHPPQTKECLSGLPLNGRLERSKILQYLIYYQELLTYVLLEQYPIYKLPRMLYQYAYD